MITIPLQFDDHRALSEFLRTELALGRAVVETAVPVQLFDSVVLRLEARGRWWGLEATVAHPGMHRAEGPPMVGLQTRLGPDDRVEIAKLIRWLEVSADRRARGSASGSMSDTAELAPTRTRASSADFVAAMEARETPVAANPAVSVGASGQADGVEPAGRPNERRSATDTSRALQAASLYEAARADLIAGVLDRAIRDLQLAVAYDPTVAEYREALAQAEERAARPRA